MNWAGWNEQFIRSVFAQGDCIAPKCKSPELAIMAKTTKAKTVQNRKVNIYAITRKFEVDLSLWTVEIAVWINVLVIKQLKLLFN